MEELFDPAAWLAQGRAFCELARSGKVKDDYNPDVELTYDVAAWPQPWIAADLLTYELGSAREAELGMVLTAENDVLPRPTGDVDALLAAGDLEAAWRACFDPELADVIEARDAAMPIEKIKEPKKKSELEKVWAAAAESMAPRSAFAGTWPTKWKDAQRRMRVLYARPRSPLFAAAALTFANRDDLGYTSISAQTFWQALCWFIAAQGDVRQLPALEALERRVCEIEERKELFATRALQAFAPRELPEKTRAAIAALVVEKPARAALSITSPEERGVAADQLLLEGDPRGEFIVVQQRIIDDGPTKELLKQQKQLLKQNIRAWCPAMIVRDTCVFRGGVPVAGQLQFHSDVELRSFAGSKSLATFETLLVPDAAMGPIKLATIADVVRSLPALRHVITSDSAANKIGAGEPTTLEQLTVTGEDGRINFGGPGLPSLRRVDAHRIPPAWPATKWFPKLAAIGCADPDAWLALVRAEHAPAMILIEHFYLTKTAKKHAPLWELWASATYVTAKPRAGSNAASLAASLERVPSWDGIAALRVPSNFTAKLAVKIAVEPIDPVEPAGLGIALQHP